VTPPLTANQPIRRCPHNAADATRDPDRDALTSRGEYRHGGEPRDEDTDSDGHEEGDDIRGGSDVDVRDSDDDGRIDGHEAGLKTG